MLRFALFFMLSVSFAQEIPEDLKPPSWHLTNVNPLLINEFNLGSLIGFYSNLVNYNLNISLTNVNTDLDYQIFNTIGQIVSKGRLTPNRVHIIDMSQYHRGIYFVKLSMASHSVIRKIIKK